MKAKAPSKNTTLLSHRATEAETFSACMAYGHGFEGMKPEEQKKVRHEALEWVRAWGIALPKAFVRKAS